MGNSSSRTSTKIILSDGRITTADPSATVGELMLDHAHHFVVDFNSLLSEDKPAALPADQKLCRGKTYLMIPMKSGKRAALSSAEAKEALKRVRSILYISGFSSPSCWPCLHKAAEEKSPEMVKSPETSLEISSELPEFLGRQLSCKGWKPSLQTIEEMTRKREPHWLFS